MDRNDILSKPVDENIEPKKSKKKKKKLAPPLPPRALESRGWEGFS